MRRVRSLCSDRSVVAVESIDVGEVSDSFPGSLAAHNIMVITRGYRIWLDVSGVVCFDEAGQRYIVFTIARQRVEDRGRW